MVLTLHDTLGNVAAIVIRNYIAAPGLHFFGEPSQPIQLGVMKYRADKIIAPHYHNLVERKTLGTAEVLFIKSGRVELEFYSDPVFFPYRPTTKCELRQGDVVVLLTGGHGFKVLEEAEIWEVKLGPYFGDKDKTLINT